MKNWTRPSRPILSGLASLCLGLSLTACSPKVITKSVPIAPPAQYYEGDCAITPYVITDNGSMAEAIRSLINDIRVCSADRKAIRAWKDKL